ncbi:hypothetical protein LLG95_07420 [bacterium]|nr:hypothetical protein [bacterium]
MQWRKFYGRTMAGALARVKRELGADALIVESRMIEPDSAAARMNPGAKYEIVAVRERATTTLAAQESGVPRLPATGKSSDLLEDLGLLRSQINQLLTGDESPDSSCITHHSSLDLADYHDLIARGVDHRVIAPQFRAWLNWRLAPKTMRHYMAAQGNGPAAKMEGDSLREWLWQAWAAEQGLEANPDSGLSTQDSELRTLALLGPTGCGKTTTLAKISSKLRQEGRQNIAIATLDGCRFGAVEQWRRIGKLIGVEIHEIASEADATRCMESWDSLDWVGIDTPGGMTPDSTAGRLYGSILARCPNIESAVVVPMTQQEPISRRSIERGKSFGASRLLFTKLDETEQTGSILNLTMNQQLKIDGFATGTRVPEDWERASADSLWRRVLAPAGGMC